MSKKMLINATLPEEDRVAIVEDGILTELDIETAGRQQTKGNIYKAEVIRVEQGLQAAFVDYGAQRPGFLQIGEIHPSLYPKRDNEEEGHSNRRPAITEILKRGQQILVQVVKEERGTKGAALTTEISLPGRYMVLIPQSSSRGISRKIDNDQVRKGIKQALASLELPDNMGYIIRTAAIDQPPEELKRDFDYLLNTYNSIVSHSEKAKAPALIYQESNLVLRSIRDYFTPQIDEVLIDDREVFQQARDFFKAVMPDHMHLVKLHQERRPIFARYQIEEQISQLSSNTITLPSGGSIVLDQTEALVAIDVNSGKMGGEQDVEATAHRVNLEAAVEVARQLRLRDMGGLIVIDFIDMRQRRNAREVEKALKTALKIDKARVTVGRISHQFGLLEMSRQRIKANLGEGSYHVCPHCQGTGRIRSEESRSIALLRRIQAGTAKGHIEAVTCITALDAANYLLNNKRRELFDLEQRYKLTIEIKGDPLYQPEQLDIEFIKQSRDSQEGQNKELAPLVDTDLSERANIDVVMPEVVHSDEEAPADSVADKNTTDEPARKPRRRRRSNRRRNDRQRNGESSRPEENDADQTEENTSSPETSATTADTGQESPESTPRPTITSAEKSTDESTPAEQTPAGTDENTDSEATAEEKPRRKTPRRRAPRKKPASQATENTVKAETAGETSEATQGSADAAQPSTSGDTVAAAEKPKRRTTRRKPSVSHETAEQAVETMEIKEDTTAQDTDKKPAPPRRRTTRRKNVASEDAAQAKAGETSASPTTTGTPEEKMEKKHSPQRNAAENPGEGDAAASAPVAEQSDAEKKPAPRRRRTTKKTASHASEEVSTTPSQESTTPTEEAPKPKRRTTRRKTATEPATTDTATETPKAGGEDAEAVKKPVRRRRTTKAQEETASEATTATEEPKKRTTRRKKAEPKPAETAPEE
jgi:ribonuclease E